MRRVISKPTELLIRYTGACKSGAYFDSNKLPQINGARVESIYSPDDFSNDPRSLNATGWHYSTQYHTKQSNLNFIGVLLPEFKSLFGNQVINGISCFVKNIDFRTDSSGHASEDSIMTIMCGNDIRFSVWEREEGITLEYNQALTQHDEYVKKWLSFFNKKFTLKYPSYVDCTWEPTYPNLSPRNGTFIENIGGLNYPTTFSLHWKPFNTMPYVTTNDGKTIRFFDTDYNSHIFIERVEKIEAGEENLIICSFPQDEYSEYFLHARKGEDGKGFIRYTVETVHKDNTITVLEEVDGKLKHRYRNVRN